MILIIEAALDVLVLALAFAVPNLGSRWFEVLERSCGKLAGRRGLSVNEVSIKYFEDRHMLLVHAEGNPRN